MPRRRAAVPPVAADPVLRPFSVSTLVGNVLLDYHLITAHCGCGRREFRIEHGFGPWRMVCMNCKKARLMGPLVTGLLAEAIERDLAIIREYHASLLKAGSSWSQPEAHREPNGTEAV